MADQFIKSRAAVAWEAGKPLSIEEVDVMLPKAGEVWCVLSPPGYVTRMLLLYPVMILKAFSRRSSAMKAAGSLRW